MSWKALRDDGRVLRLKVDKPEIDEMRKAIKRTLRDASLKGLSNESRFELSQMAAMLTAKMAVKCAGYRVKGAYPKQTLLEGLGLALGTKSKASVDYLDACRRKRRDAQYVPGRLSADDAEEMLKFAKKLVKDVEMLISKRYPKLK